jgi:hypothetical protein
VTPGTPPHDFETLKTRNCCVLNLTTIGVQIIAPGCTFSMQAWEIDSGRSRLGTPSFAIEICALDVTYVLGICVRTDGSLSPVRDG